LRSLESKPDYRAYSAVVGALRADFALTGKLVALNSDVIHARLLGDFGNRVLRLRALVMQTSEQTISLPALTVRASTRALCALTCGVAPLHSLPLLALGHGRTSIPEPARTHDLRTAARVRAHAHHIDIPLKEQCCTSATS
jgi:hypothetical protein